MPADVHPYFVPHAETVSWGPWLLFDGSAWEELPEEVDGWDPGTDLHLARKVQVNPARLWQETGLQPADLALTVSWRSSTTTMTEAAVPASFTSDGVATIEPVLVGDRLSGVLEILTTLTLAHRPDSVQVGMATIPGSVLTEDKSHLTLESNSSLFPIHEIDFAGTRLSPAASWHLETTTDLDSPFYGSFRILVNRRDKELSSAAVRGAKDRRQQALLDELEGGVVALLLDMALHLRQELDERESWPVDSVGDVLSRLIESVNLDVPIPTGALELADYRTQLAGAVRSSGKGRNFA